MSLFVPARSDQLEIIDREVLGRADMSQVLDNLETINRLLGGHATTLKALDRLVPRDVRELRILDVGAGGGDMTRVLMAWGRRTGRTVRVVSIDLSGDAVTVAHERLQDVQGATVVQGDVLSLPFRPGTFDVVLCALFLHHFKDRDVVRVLRSLVECARYGVIVNDLHRHPLAYAGIWVLTRVFGAHAVVQHDAPLSVLRGFRRSELRQLTAELGRTVRLRWEWAFRYGMTIAADPELADSGHVGPTR